MSSCKKTVAFAASVAKGLEMKRFGVIFIAILYLVIFPVVSNAKSYENGLIFYNLTTRQMLLPPVVTGPMFRTYLQLPSIGQPCNCEGPSCECCVGIKIDRFNFDQKMCTNAALDLAHLEIKLDVLLNERNIIMYTMSASNPPPFCIPVQLPIPVYMCMKMHDIQIINDGVQMCMDWLVRVGSSDVFVLHFRCFHVGPGGIMAAPGQQDEPIIVGDVNSDVYDEVDLD